MIRAVRPAAPLIALLAGVPILAARQPSDPGPKTAIYEPGPDSLPQDGVPKGRLEGPFEFRSRILADTVRRYCPISSGTSSA